MLTWCWTSLPPKQMIIAASYNRTISFYLILLLLGRGGSFYSLSAAVIFSSLNNQEPGYNVEVANETFNHVSWAQSFVTDAHGDENPEFLGTVGLGFQTGEYGGGYGGGLAVALYDTSGPGDTPGNLLETLTGSANPATDGNYTYTATGTTFLTASTAYFIVVTDYGTGHFYWATSGAYVGQSIGDALNYNDGTGWEPFGLTHALEVTVVPEASIYTGLEFLAVILGLEFCARLKLQKIHRKN